MSGFAVPKGDVVRLALVLGLLVLAGVLLHLLGPILLPFLVALALAYLWDPVVDRLERTGLGRTLAVSLVFLLTPLLVLPLFRPAIPAEKEDKYAPRATSAGATFTVPAGWMMTTRGSRSSSTRPRPIRTWR